MASASDCNDQLLEEASSADCGTQGLLPGAPKRGMGRKGAVIGLLAVALCAALISGVPHSGPAKATPDQAVKLTAQSAGDQLSAETKGKPWVTVEQIFHYIEGTNDGGYTPTSGISSIKSWYDTTATADEKASFTALVQSSEAATIPPGGAVTVPTVAPTTAAPTVAPSPDMSDR
jgi:hypothetical protein